MRRSGANADDEDSRQKYWREIFHGQIPDFFCAELAAIARAKIPRGARDRLSARRHP